MSTVKATNVQHASATSPNIVLGSDGSVAVGGGNISPQTGFKNRIINPGMVVDQRNSGAAIASVGSGAVYTVDRFYLQCDASGRFSFQQNQGSVTPPAGFSKYAGFTSLGANSPTASQYNVFAQAIEGFNAADLAWGTASAQTVTLSFWVRSSVTGSLGAAIINGSSNRSYSFLYTVSASNTWEYKTVTIPGDTSGTWATDNSAFALIRWSLGSGSSLITTPNQWNASNSNGATGQVNVSATNGATWQITGVQLEKGSVATPFEFRSIGQELALCQRYFQVIKAGIGVAATTSAINFTASLFVPMRAAPSVSKYTAFGGVNFLWGDMVSLAFLSSDSPTISNGFNNLFVTGIITGFTGLTQYRSYRHEPTDSGGNSTLFAFSSEL